MFLYTFTRGTPCTAVSYTSRYSDYDGYWLFGLVVGDIDELRIDLLSPSAGAAASAPVAVAIRLAGQKFREQMEKAGSAVSCAREARLDITRSPSSHNGVVNGRLCAGYNVRFRARVVSDYGKTYESETSVFVAPHDSQVELRSTRGT